MTHPLFRHLDERPLLIDGAMGTSLHACNCDLHRDYLGKENCSEIIVRTRPDVIRRIHETFLLAGADAVETDTFGANPIVLAEFDLADQARVLNKEGAEIARAACDAHSTADKPRFVLGSIGPGTKLVTLGHTTWDDLLASYTEQARGLLDGGVDAFLIETCQDILQVKCAINACQDALAERGRRATGTPIMVSITIETTGTMLVGTEIAAAATALKPYPIASLGLNCATGPTEMADHIRWLSRHWDRPISVVPNAGLPILVDGRAEYPLKPRPFAAAVARYVREFGVSIVGGCCGTTPEHIAALASALSGVAPAPREIEPTKPACTSLYWAVEYEQDNSILIVGERTNTNGSRQFKNLLSSENFDGLVSMAREQLRDGSHLIDVCVDYVGRDGVRDMREVVSRFARQVPTPIMIDSTQIDVMEAGLKHAGGKCLLNSMNLEDGEEKLAAICRLARRFGAGVVAGTIDEDPVEAMAKTAERKIAIAERIADLAVNKYGLAPEDIFFDPLVLPVTTGVEADRRLALETIEGTRRISERLPRCNTIVGLSNVSFGLKPAARVVLNSVFLHELRNAGLTGAIVAPSKILPKNRINDERWDAALDLIYDRRRDGFDPLQAYIKLFPDDETPGEARIALEDLPLEDRLQRHIIDGEKAGLVETLDEALTRYNALAIVNDHLLEGMKVVGELFGRGEMQLPFVLQSAEVMKAAVARLEPHMPKVEGKTSKGSIVLATVQGDVHDIGKNLVDIILTNNGYTVHNIGIKQPIANILTALDQHRADAVGLSGLLVKSVGVMQDNLREMAERGVRVPVLLGGAALTRHYCETQLRATYISGRVYYGRDAFEGLRLMDHIARADFDTLDRQIADRLAKRADAEQRIAAAKTSRREAAEFQEEPGGVKVLEATEPAAAHSVSPVDIPDAPFWGSRVVESIPLEEVYPYVNKVALYRGQWQFKKGRKSDVDYAAQVSGVVDPIFERLCAACDAEGVLTPRVVYGYYPAASAGDDLIVFDPGDHEREIERFIFPRQMARRRLCISDFFRDVDSGGRDVLGLSCVTVGEKVSQRARTLFERDDYTEYLYLHGFGVECAEALAELWHKRMRQELGVAGDDAPAIRDLFTQKYRGSRYSFGYPACPEMSDQDKLFRLLQPERIGCRLTENRQIDPEQSTSALIVHHPEAKYFNV